MSKPILCVDFDGVVHAYTSKWTDAVTISDGPVPGALRWLWKATEWFNVTIYSSRSKVAAAIPIMRDWMKLHAKAEFGNDHPMCGEEGVAYLIDFATEKPAAFMTIDDRAVCFEGNWDELDPADLLGFKPWNKRDVRVEEPDSPLGASFKVSIMSSGDIGRLTLSKDGAEIRFTKEQAQSLANEIVRALGGDGA